MVKTNTRRVARRKNFMTIPEIKSAFESIEQATYRILREGGTLSEQVKKFQTEWKAIFHRPVRAESAEAYLKIKQISKKRPSKTRKQKNASLSGGGGGISGAPLDYATRPGIYGNGNYGSFLAYQTMGSAVPPPSIAMTADCGVKDFSPSVASVAAVQTGGTLGDVFHRAFIGPSASAVLPTRLNDVDAILGGMPPSPSPAPYQHALKL
jgi:hypothetical protein